MILRFTHVVVMICSSLFMSDIPVYEHTTVCFFILLLIKTWASFQLKLLPIKLL